MLKGTSDGVFIEIEDKNIENEYIDLKNKLRKTNFFTGSTEFLLDKKHKEHYNKFKKLLNEYGHELYIVTKETPDFNKNTYYIPKETFILKSNIEVGKKLIYDGDVIIFGNIEKKGEVFVTGNIHIFGEVSGELIAGANGNKNVEIIVFSLKEGSNISLAGRKIDFKNIVIPESPIKLTLNNEEKVIMEKVKLSRKVIAKKFNIERK